ncbi:hypothetical protein B2G71_19595 [Novosphingobium sp. PC22D]|uniref:DeoxyPurine in DNA protein A domain-containing protein n=1 Tax=Novosphingobium indicum TaxID=462949 RepID=A0ABQ2JSX8_9SPHN|nr:MULTISPECIES: hypothetical protein [Novosphingobium]PEQ11018.1 hypothetical protein B2G71_19595 [Novosphingobium sp. PC22D]GGN55534.1 hypothetical protein GCM10011349_32280 [Novosphingobium indicum]
MTIEVIIGLPHLNEGPILQRARMMQQPMLISANCLSRWRTASGGWREWQGWRTGQLANAHGLKSLDLDSAGYVLMARYGGYPWSIADYMALAASYPFRRFAAADYCCEAEIANDRAEVLDRISRTVATNRECRSRAADLGIIDRFMPVLQGRYPQDYERCAEALAWSMLPGAVVGVGSMCRRDIDGPDGLLAVVAHLDKILPNPGPRLHLFGVKGSAIPYLQPYAHRVASLDSQAWGTAARRDAHRRRVSKSDELAADHMERWTGAQLDRLSEPHRPLAIAPSPVPKTMPADPWEAAVEQARDEMRALIESGDLAHDEVTGGWIEAWAADIYRERPNAA